MARDSGIADAAYTKALKRIEECGSQRQNDLDFSGLGLTTLPPEIGQLTALTALNLSNNQLSQVPPEIGQLTALTALNLSNNQLSEVPPEIGQLIALTKLNLSNNELIAVPPEIGQLTALTVLHLSNNQLSTLPPEIGRLSRLRLVTADNNQLRELPESLREFGQLQKLTLHGNDVLGLPNELLGPKWNESASHSPPADPHAILDYYFARRLEGEEPMREVRLMLVGRGRAGKTTLLKALRGEQPDKLEPETPGITVQSLDLKCEKGTAIGHVWDFGGQEFLHGTHQIFLSERCVYLVVLDGREGDWEVETDYWLRYIQSFGLDSPVIVVLSKYDAHPFSVDRFRLIERCPQIVGFVETDAFTHRGIRELTAQLGKTVNEMKDVWLGVPRKWHRVKQQLTEMGHSFLEYRDYQALCLQTGVDDDGKQISLAQTLHRLGIALNFRDHPRLRQTSVLKPKWVTEAIYGLIRYVQRQDCHGVLEQSWMKRALDPVDYPEEKHGFVFELMEKFEVDFPLEGTLNWLIPELLREEQPEPFAEFRSPGVRRLRFAYPDALPPGLLPRLIVRTHEMSESHPEWRWRSGVVLEWQGARALVRLNRMERRTEVAVIECPTADRQSLFDLIRAHLAVLHGQVRFIEEVELRGHPDSWVRVDKLRRLEAKGAQQSEEQTKEGELATIDVTETLDGVESLQAREADRKTAPPRLRLYVSYAHADAKKIAPLSKHLTILGHRGYIQTWQDTQLVAGEEWEDRILEELNRADIVLLLYSTNSRASSYIQEIEAPTAVRRAKDNNQNCILIVVPLDRRDWDEDVALEQDLKKFQTATWNAKPVLQFSPQSKGWQEVERTIRSAVEMQWGRTRIEATSIGVSLQVGDRTARSETSQVHDAAYDEAVERIEACRKQRNHSLDLGQLGLTTLPPEIGQLTSLMSLDLNENRLTTLPFEIIHLKSLATLELTENQFTSLPPEILQLTSLEKLDLSGNRLKTLPKEIARLKQLERLILESTALRELPKSLKELTRLKELMLHGNDELGLPTELLGPIWSDAGETNPPANPQDILDYYFAQRAGIRQPLNEVKVLVVGESEVGKTSLIRQLRGENHRPNEDKTHGIERHQVPMACGRIGEVRLNVWDFGGQDIMHATHQFFLTHRSVYLLVLDSRHDERQSRIDYWLRLIASYGGDSPVIVVCNKSDQHVMQLNWTALQREYPQIKAYAKEVCCYHFEGDDRRKGLRELKHLLADTIENDLPDVGQPVLASWLSLKNELEKDARPYLSLVEYHQLAEQRGLKTQRDRDVLLTLMHHLGSVLHFSEHSIFDKERQTNSAPVQVEAMNVLDPDWITGAIYNLLNDAELIRAGGILDRSSLRRCLAKPVDRYPPSKEDFIIAMMRRFQLCFAFDGEQDRWFLPDLLHKDEVDTGDWRNALIFRYQYRVLPSSVIGRLMVRLHGHIARHCLWRTGAKFSLGVCEALVRSEPEETQPRLEIFIRNGALRERREFLALIRGTLADIHHSFSDNLGVEQLVTVPGHPDVFVDHERLLLKEGKEPTATDEVKVDGELLEFKVADALNAVTEPKSRDTERINLSQKEQGKRGEWNSITVINVQGDLIKGHKPMNNDHSINIGGNVINSQVGATLTNCNNMVQQQPFGPRKSLLETLTHDVHKLIESLPHDRKKEAQDVADNLETLIKQASKAAPNRKWYSLSAVGLLEASKWVKDFTGNIGGTLLKLGKSFWPDFQISESK